ncbi:MAG: hypothetical protein CMJ90_04440 [Planctomycetes bacterium]|nr:hypothetical protein [Planctomycetota bacterium]
MRFDLHHLVRKCGALVIVIGVALSAAAPAQIVYPDFSATVGMALNGSAGQLGNSLMLTPAANTQAGTAWFQTQQSVTSGFVTTFEFRITPTGAGADGMTFIIQDDPAGTSAIAQGGGSLAYTSEPLVPTNTLVNLLVIELDTYQNGNFADPDANHISVHLIPTLPTTVNGADEYYSIGRVSPTINMSDGATHTVCISYVPGTLDIFLDNFASPILSVPFDFLTGATNLTGTAIGGLNFPNGTAYVGFTGGTGGLNQLNEVLSWEFGGPGCPLNPWEVNSPASSLDINGNQSVGLGPAVTSACIGSNLTLNSAATAGAPSDIAIAFASPIPAGLTTGGGQQVNIDVTHPSLFSFNGGAASFAGILNLQPHPGTFTFSIPTAGPFFATAQQLAIDTTHPDGFQLSQACEVNLIAGGLAVGLELGDDTVAYINYQNSPFCGTMPPITFYGTTHPVFWVHSNGEVYFQFPTANPTPAFNQYLTWMPRVGMWTDFAPDVAGSVSVSASATEVKVSFQNVASAGTSATANSFDITFTAGGATIIDNYTPDPGHIHPTIAGISRGGGSTDPGPMGGTASGTIIGNLGAGTQSGLATDAIYEIPTAGLPAGGWNSLTFPFSDGSAWIVN